MWLILFEDLEYIFQDLEYIFQDLKHQAISEGKKIITKYKKIKIAIMANYVERRCPTKLTNPTRTITQASLVGARTQLLKASALMIPKYRRGTQLEEDYFNIEEDEII